MANHHRYCLTLLDHEWSCRQARSSRATSSAMIKCKLIYECIYLNKYLNYADVCFNWINKGALYKIMMKVEPVVSNNDELFMANTTQLNKINYL